MLIDVFTFLNKCYHIIYNLISYSPTVIHWICFEFYRRFKCSLNKTGGKRQLCHLSLWLEKRKTEVISCIFFPLNVDSKIIYKCASCSTLQYVQFLWIKLKLNFSVFECVMQIWLQNVILNISVVCFSFIYFSIIKCIMLRCVKLMFDYHLPEPPVLHLFLEFVFVLGSTLLACFLALPVSWGWFFSCCLVDWAACCQW